MRTLKLVNLFTGRTCHGVLYFGQLYILHHTQRAGLQLVRVAKQQRKSYAVMGKAAQ